ncbi:MAG TPA: hypothetical protein VGD95_03685 [Micavibrio sp.]
MKIKSVLGVGLAGLLLAGLSGSAHAQVPLPMIENTLGPAVPACDLTREVISVLRLPIPGSPVSWQTAFGDQGHYTEFGGAVGLPSYTVATYAGRVDPHTMKAIDTGIVEVNRRGRAVVEQYYPAKNDEHVVGLVRVEERYVGVSNMRVGNDHQVRVSFYEADGTFKKAQVISDALYDLDAVQLVNAVDGQGFVVVMQAIARKDKLDQSAMLMRFDANGQQLWKRSFRPGTSNKIAGLSATDDKGYIASGGIMMQDGRMAGWALKLSAEGTILWQQTYPRGKYAMLNAGVVSAKKTPDGLSYYAFSGVSTPGDNGPDAAWIMETDPYGILLWQRYLRRPDFRFEGMGLRAAPDGRLVAALKATNQGADPAHKDHARLITLSPRGIIINDETVLNGVGATPLAFGQTISGDFVLGGATKQPRPAAEELYGPQKPLPEGQVAAEPAPYTAGWVAVMPALGAYTDPCGPVQK